MTTPAHYPYSRIYLRQRMANISAGIVRLSIFGISALIAAAILHWLATLTPFV